MDYLIQDTKEKESEMGSQPLVYQRLRFETVYEW